jgi:hypothetical protein
MPDCPISMNQVRILFPLVDTKNVKREYSLLLEFHSWYVKNSTYDSNLGHQTHGSDLLPYLSLGGSSAKNRL